MSQRDSAQMNPQPDISSGFFIGQNPMQRRRFRMKHRILFTSIVAIIALLLLAPAGQALAAGEPVDAALDWLEQQQSADGGFSDGFSPESSVAPTAEAVIALAAGGRDPGMVQSADGASPLDFLYQQVASGQVEGIGTTAKVLMALVAAGLDGTDFADQDLIGGLQAAYDADTGSYGGSIFDQALVMLALANAGQPVPQAAADYLMSYQTTDGAWNFMGDTAEQTGDTNTTALAVQALVAAGRADDAEAALSYLRQVQNEDGGWPYQNPSPYGTETDANSTALVLEAIYAAGQAPEDWAAPDGDPLNALLGLQNESGSFSYQASMPGDNALATIQAVPAVQGATLVEVPREATAADPGMAGAGAAQTGQEGSPSTLPQSGGAPGSWSVILLVIGVLSLAGGQALRLWHKRAA
jgi:squalene cyclase